MRISDWSSDVCSSDLISFLQLRAGGCRRWNSTQEPNRCLRRCIHRLLGGARNHRVCPALRRFCRLPPGTSPTYCNDAKQASLANADTPRSEEHTSELQSLMRISYAVFCLKKKKTTKPRKQTHTHKTT